MFDADAKRVWREDRWDLPFDRRYSPTVFKERIFSEIPEEMFGRVLFFNNLEEVMSVFPGQVVYCFFMFICEKKDDKAEQ